MMDREHKLRKHRQDSLYRKIQVLTHYSPGKKLGCSWPGCKVRDLQCLTLDHTENNGAAHRRQLKSRSSTSLYRAVVKLGFPAGFRCLCANHQLKAELQRRIKSRSTLHLREL